MSLEMFGNTAKGLTKNPISLIGLFLVLVYGIAAMVVSVNVFGATERLILVLFMVLFPFAVLFVFYKLVSSHHNKLYAPSDYKDESNFVRSFDLGVNAQLEQVVLKQSSSPEMEQMPMEEHKLSRKRKVAPANENTVDWSDYNISVNRLLDNVGEISVALKDAGVPSYTLFKTEKPSCFTLGFSNRVAADGLKALISVLQPLGLDSLRYIGSDRLKKKDFYIGSMAYKYQMPVAKLNAALVAKLLDEGTTIDEMVDLVEQNSKVL